MDIKVCNKIKEMAKTRYDLTIYNKYYEIFDFKNKEVILKDDWYLVYKEYKDALEICDWLSIDNGNDIKRLVEMNKIIPKILIDPKGVIKATLRHGTSYKIYKVLKDNGYIKTIDEYLFLDRNIDVEICNIIDSYMLYESPLYLKKVLDSHKELKEYYPYFLYDVTFEVTDKFVKKYNYLYK